MKSRKFVLSLLIFLLLSGIWITRKFICNTRYEIGEPLDSLNGVLVYYNGRVSRVSGRNTSDDGYNLGLKYQCVEFVKRYYYEYLNHKMPDSYGHAKDFFDASLPDGAKNDRRNLMQYRNRGKTKPAPDDLIVFKATVLNRYGHVAIVSKVEQNYIEIVQQNPGISGKSRKRISLENQEDSWSVDDWRCVGWLRKEN